MTNPKAKLSLSKPSKILILFFVLVTVLFLGWWYIHTNWYIGADCMPGIIGFEKPQPYHTAPELILKNIFQPKYKCVSW